MARYFNVTGSCDPEKHYMVNLDSRIDAIKQYIDSGNYFAINKGRQYGKTTTINALEHALQPDYTVVGLDFQIQVSSALFYDEESFSNAFAAAFTECLALNHDQKLFELAQTELAEVSNLVSLFKKLSTLCGCSAKPIVLIIDEVDSASNNQVFLDFLAQLRGYYLTRNKRPTFQSVILAGVHDIRNLRQKIRPDAEHRHNSPWNIASDFDVEMSFSPDDIAGMLSEYENDHHTGMDLSDVAQGIYDYTSGYPVLVSWLCKLMDESKHNWNREGIAVAHKDLIMKDSPLFESLINKLEDDDELRNMIHEILFNGKSFMFNKRNAIISSAAMYGFVKNQNGTTAIANRIFETVIYEWFISCEATSSELSTEGFADKNQFIVNGHLNMELVMEKFAEHFNDIYGEESVKFKENEGRKYFLLYLRPIINGVGNYYIEAQTRDMRRTDIIVDYLGEQFIIEMKIWHGDRYNEQGEQQLAEYLEYYHASKGYLLSFQFQSNKQIGTRKISINGKTIIETIV